MTEPAAPPTGPPGGGPPWEDTAELLALGDAMEAAILQVSGQHRRPCLCELCNAARAWHLARLAPTGTPGPKW